MPKVKAQGAARRTLFEQRVGADLRLLRQAAGLPLDEVAAIAGWGRAALSKIERGDRPIAMFDYATLVEFYQELAPDHPGVALAHRYLPRPRPLRRG